MKKKKVSLPEKSKQVYNNINNNKKAKKHLKDSTKSFSQAAFNVANASNKKKALKSKKVKKSVSRGYQSLNKAQRAYKNPRPAKGKLVTGFVLFALTVWVAVYASNKKGSSTIS
jgi:hypothetical protein